MLRCLRFAGVALLVVWASKASAQDNDIAQRLAAEIRSSLPGATVTIPDLYGLDITYEGQTRSVGIGSVHGACSQGVTACDAAIHAYAQRAASYLLETAPLRRDQLRAVVRSVSYLEAMRAQMRSSDSFVSEPLAGDLVGVCYRVLSQGRRPIVSADLAPLQLDAPAALTLCKSNADQISSPLESQWNELPDQGIGVIHFDGEVAAYLLSPEDWRPLAERLGGLVVAAPSADTVLYGRGVNAIDVDALATLATQMRAQASVPLSSEVFRWTEHGWVVAQR